MKKYCEECGREVEIKLIAKRETYEVINFYCRKKKIREQYGLSQRSFAKLLNWGDKTICRYENGSIQDKAHNSLLLFLREPENMRAYLTEIEVVLADRQKIKLLETVDELEFNNEYRAGRKIFDLFFSLIPCEENGFKGFDYEKLCAMVLFFYIKMLSY